MGLVAVAFAVMIAIWVAITLRPLRRLRAAAARVAAGDYANRIDEKGPSEVADLAREFNAMARAVDEREHELVRSERLAAIGKLSAMMTTRSATRCRRLASTPSYSTTAPSRQRRGSSALPVDSPRGPPTDRDHRGVPGVRPAAETQDSSRSTSTRWSTRWRRSSARTSRPSTSSWRSSSASTIRFALVDASATPTVPRQPRAQRRRGDGRERRRHGDPAHAARRLSRRDRGRGHRHRHPPRSFLGCSTRFSRRKKAVAGWAWR